MTNRKWVTCPYSSIMPHSMTNSKWVILLHFFARQSHKSCLIPWPTGGECLDTLLYFFARQSHQPCIIPHQGVSDIYVFARQSHQSYLIPWPTVCEWHCLFLCHMSFLIIWLIGSEWHCIASFPGSLRSITSHPMTNSKWVTLHDFLPRQFHHWCLIPWLTVCEWRCCISLLWLHHLMTTGCKSYTK